MMQLSEAAIAVDGKLVGANVAFSGVTIDSRNVSSGALFVAIKGDRFDGHDYLYEALDRGAVGAIVERVQEQADGGQIIVEDTTLALGRLGSAWRARHDIPVVAVTGSNGKTTVSALVAAVLNERGQCIAPKGSFNNHWGVPLTLLRLTPEDRYLVVEMGMNHPGELDYLSALATPTVAVINNVAPAHLGGLGSVDNIAQAKAEILNGLSPQGIAVLNADDHYCDMFEQRLTDQRVIRFASEEGGRDAHVRFGQYQPTEQGGRFMLAIGEQGLSIELPLFGQHNASNAAAAAAVGFGLGLGLHEIQSGLQNVSAVPGRLVIKPGLNGSQVIDDSYNANPHSIKAAIDVLAQSSRRGVLVLGKMAELGENSTKWHIEVGQYAKGQGIEQLFVLSEGDKTDKDAEGYLKGFGPGSNIYRDIGTLVTALTEQLDETTLMVVKGSRSAGMERVVARITDE